MLKELVLSVVVFTGTSACRGRDAGRRVCPPPGVPDPSLLLAGWWNVVGGADEAWSVGQPAATPSRRQRRSLAVGGHRCRAARLPLESRQLGGLDGHKIGCDVGIGCSNGGQMRRPQLQIVPPSWRGGRKAPLRLAMPFDFVALRAA